MSTDDNRPVSPAERIAHYRQRAEDLRTLQVAMHSAEARAAVQETIDDYERLAGAIEGAQRDTSRS